MEGKRNMEEEKKLIINENVDGKLTKMEDILKEVVLPIRAGADFVNQALISPLSDELKEKIVDEIYEDMKKRVDKDGV